MKVVFATIWLLSNGQMYAEPWIRFADIATCKEHRDQIMPHVSDERLLFFTACVDTTADIRTEAFHFTVEKAP